MQNFRNELATFTLENLPDLDAVVRGSLELFSDTDVPHVDYHQFKRPLVVGSGNAAVAGKIIFNDTDAIFADESSYMEILESKSDIDGAFLISASGSKHAIPIVQELARRSVHTVLLTNNPEAPAREFLNDSECYVFPKNREPYTYNTSTYMGMLLSKTQEDPRAIDAFIEEHVLPLMSHDFASHGAFYLIVPEAFNDIRDMFKTKFDELFGPLVMGRIFTKEQTKHAKTVIPHETELFISFGEENTLFGKPENRITIPLPHNADFGAMMAIGYFVIGSLQKKLPPYYKERIEAYTQETSQMFGSVIEPIVE